MNDSDTETEMQDREQARLAFGRALKAEREQVGATPAQLAGAIGRTPGVVYNYEAGRVTVLNPWDCMAFEDYLQLKPGTLTQVLGFVPLDADTPPCTVRVAIEADPMLNENARVALRGTLSFVQQQLEG